MFRICLEHPPTGTNRQPTAGWPILPRPSIAQTPQTWCRNINLLSIAYAFRPRLRDRLTLSGLTFPRKPWVFGERVFHPFCRYSCQHTRFHCVHRSFRYGFNRLWNAPLPMLAHPAASVACLSPGKFSAQTHLTSELLRFL
jgi:hypothetical protein